MSRHSPLGSVGKIIIAGLLAANCSLLLQPAQGQPAVEEPQRVVAANSPDRSGEEAWTQIKADLEKFTAERKRLERQVYLRMRHCQRLAGLRDYAPTGGHRMRPIEPVPDEENELILAAGEHQFESCVDLLLNRITYSKAGTGGGLGGIGGIGAGLWGIGGVDGIAGTGDGRPVSVYKTLLQIGPRAAEGALERIPYEADPKTREMMTSLIHNVYNRSSVDRLQDLKEDRMYTSAERDARIDEAVELIVQKRVRPW